MATSSAFSSICWLLLLYTLQGVPLGMSAVFQLLLKDHGASYSDLALFSMSAWPFAMKLLWAPIVDSTALPFLKKRKSWLLVTQLCIAAILYHLSNTYTQLLETGAITHLTAFFFALYFLAATQDIAVDGWALTMLPASHVGYAGTCNSVGQTLGYFLAFSGFLSLDRFEVCSPQAFLRFWAVVFLAGTIAVCVFRKEDDDGSKYDSISDVYRKTYYIFRLPAVQLLTLVLLTWKLPFNEGLVGLKLQESGVSKDTIAVFATIITPVHVYLPWAIAKVSQRLGNMQVMYWVYPVRVLFSLAGLALVFWAPEEIDNLDLIATRLFYVALFFVSVAHAALSQGMFAPQMSFFSHVSDPALGGTYMTVLNTLSNVGGNIGGQVSLRSVDWFQKAGFDGFYASTLLGLVGGLLWWAVLGKTLLSLGRLQPEAWKVKDDKIKMF